MKKFIFLIGCICSLSVSAQDIDFGIKGGLNFGSTGDLTFTDIDLLGQIDGDNRIGYHIGVYTRLKFAGIFVQPELVYTRLNTEFENGGGDDPKYNFSKLDIPVLLGFKIIGPLNAKIGPSFQVVLNNGLDGIDDINVSDPENTFTVGYQLGLGLQLGRLGIDARYEGAFQDNQAFAQVIDGNSNLSIDSRPSQFILSLSYNLLGGDKK